MTSRFDLEALVLKSGNHKNPDEGLCLMEAVAYFAGLPHSDHPQCSSRVLTDFGIRLNDRMRDDERQKLKPFIPRLVGTNDPTKEKLRAHILCWAAVTEIAPAMLRLVKDERCEILAERLEGLSQYDWDSARKLGYESRDLCRKIRDERYNKLSKEQKAAAYAAYATADAAAYAAYAAAYAAYATADAAAYAAYAAADAADAADADADADADAADAAYAAAAAAAYAAYAAAAAAAAADAADAAAAADAADADARAKIFDLALAAFDRAIKCEEMTP